MGFRRKSSLGQWDSGTEGQWDSDLFLKEKEDRWRRRADSRVRE